MKGPYELTKTSLFKILYNFPFFPFCFNNLRVWKEYKFSLISHYLLIQACLKLWLAKAEATWAMQHLPAGKTFPEISKKCWLFWRYVYTLCLLFQNNPVTFSTPLHLRKKIQ